MFDQYSINKNKDLQDFFNGTSKYIPVKELTAILDNTSLNPNFLTEISKEISEVVKFLHEKNVTGPIAEKISIMRNSIVDKMKRLDSDNSKKLLLIDLRDMLLYIRELSKLKNQL